MKHGPGVEEAFPVLLAALMTGLISTVPAAASGPPEEAVDFKTGFLALCDLACQEINKEIIPFQEAYRTTTDPKTHHVPFFEDSYVIRALCVAYDATRETKYLDTCRHWADRVVALQSKMIPHGAYYLNYCREPGKDQGEWLVADSACVGMGVLATAVRTPQGADRDRYLSSVAAFAKLVIDNYVGKDGGITDGLWSGYNGEWWCSTATFGALMFLLHGVTGDRQYLDVALRALEWMSRHDLRRAEHISFEECAPGVVFYCGEFYATALHHLGRRATERKAALDQIKVALDWMALNQKGRGAATRWDYLKEATYMSGMPYLMYVFARALPDRADLVPAADQELRYVAQLLFKDGPPPVSRLTTWELMSWAMMSYAEKLQPGALYRNSHP